MLSAKSRETSNKDAAHGTRPKPPAPEAQQINPVWQRIATRVQAKLSVSAPDDPDEREADQVADQVMRSTQVSKIQRSCAACGAGGGTCPKCEEENIHRHADEGSGPEGSRDGGSGSEKLSLPEGFVSGLSSGQPLDSATRGFMESRFEHNFAGVRIHTDSRAAESARSISAYAYTTGPHIVFAQGQYSPGSSQGRRLLAHELTHVVQQKAGGSAIHRQACPARPAGEAAQSRAPGGILTNDVIYTPSNQQLVIRDFGVDRPDLPAGVTTDPSFERYMSLAVGDPTTALSVKGYTDCVGSAPENLVLRDQRAQAAIAAFPPALRSHTRFSFPTSPTTDFRDTNATADGRANNRAVQIRFISNPPSGTDACDVPTAASSLDEYMFLVRCAEGRLRLTAPADAPTMISVMRQLYFGSGTWSISRNPVWDSVITGRPWAPATSPETQMGTHLFNALRSSQVVGGHDMGHLLTGLDAMLNPGQVQLSMGRFTLGTGLANEEWATWAGDAGSAAAEFAVDTYANSTTGAMADYFNRFAGVDDLLGDIDSFAIRAGLTGMAPAAQLGQAVRLSGTFSEMLMQYFRISSSALGRARVDAKKNFIQAYGGTLSGSTLTNRPALEAALQPSIDNFAGRFVLFRMLQRGFLSTPPPSPGPLPTATLPTAVAEATRLFVDFLLAP